MAESFGGIMNDVVTEGGRRDLVMLGGSDDDRDALGVLLRPFGYCVRWVEDLRALRRFPEQRLPGLLLLNTRAGVDPYALCREIKTDVRLGGIPLLLAFGSRHEVDVERVFTSGCGDYLVRPYRGAETAARVISQIRLFNLEKDLVERSQELRRLSSVDTLTGLYNRRRFIEQIGQCLSRVDRYGGNCSLLVLDLDHFKRVNAVHGYDVGDEVLTEVARRIRNTLRESDLAARWAGEEFIR